MTCTPCHKRIRREIIHKCEVVGEYYECSERGVIIGPRDVRPGWCPKDTNAADRQRSCRAS